MINVFCVMKGKDSLFAIYETNNRAEDIAEQMTKKYGEEYRVETRILL